MKFTASLLISSTATIQTYASTGRLTAKNYARPKKIVSQGLFSLEAYCGRDFGPLR
ncbi:hypothetical protein CHS0354_043188, partial [Potamilus streckersoni]